MSLFDVERCITGVNFCFKKVLEWHTTGINWSKDSFERGLSIRLVRRSI